MTIVNPSRKRRSIFGQRHDPERRFFLGASDEETEDDDEVDDLDDAFVSDDEAMDEVDDDSSDSDDDDSEDEDNEDGGDDDTESKRESHLRELRATERRLESALRDPLLYMAEREELLGQINAVRQVIAQRETEATDLAWADMVVREVTGPRLAASDHSMHTDATDWLGKIATYEEAGPGFIEIEAAKWLRSSRAVLDADPEEWATQAHGAAQRLAGHLPGGSRAFLAALVRLAADGEEEPDEEQSGEAVGDADMVSVGDEGTFPTGAPIADPTNAAAYAQEQAGIGVIGPDGAVSRRNDRRPFVGEGRVAGLTVSPVPGRGHFSDTLPGRVHDARDLDHVYQIISDYALDAPGDTTYLVNGGESPVLMTADPSGVVVNEMKVASRKLTASRRTAGDSEDQQAWWDSMDLDSKKEYSKGIHSGDDLTIKLVEIDAAALADQRAARGTEEWFTAYYYEMALRGVERINGYNRLTGSRRTADWRSGQPPCSNCNHAMSSHLDDDRQTACRTCGCANYAKGSSGEDWAKSLGARKTASVGRYDSDNWVEWDYEIDSDWGSEPELTIILRGGDDDEILDTLGGVDVKFDVSDHGNVNVGPEAESYMADRAIEMARALYPDGDFYLQGPGLQGKSASRKTAAREGWDLTPSNRWPGEQALTCPTCGSQDNSIAGSSLRDYGLGRGAETVQCHNCGYKTITQTPYKDASRKTAGGRFEWLWPGTRKPDSMVCHGFTSVGGGDTANERIAQGSRSIVRFDINTGVGVANWKGSNSKHFMDLNPIMGAEPVVMPPEFLALALGNEYRSGDSIGGGVFMAARTAATNRTARSKTASVGRKTRKTRKTASWGDGAIIPNPGWGSPYGGGSPSYNTPDHGYVWMFRKGQKVRFYDSDGNQVGPEQANVAPAVAYAIDQGWSRDVSNYVPSYYGSKTATEVPGIGAGGQGDLMDGWDAETDATMPEPADYDTFPGIEEYFDMESESPVITQSSRRTASTDAEKIERLIELGYAAPGARGMAFEDVIDQIQNVNAMEDDEIDDLLASL